MVIERGGLTPNTARFTASRDPAALADRGKGGLKYLHTGIDMSANAWCSSEADEITLRELKHTYTDGNRVLSLLMLESAPPNARFRSGWEDEVTQDTFDLIGLKSHF